MIKKILTFGGVGIVVLGLVVRFGLPTLLTALGLHPHYEIPDMDLGGKRALIVTTSHDTLGDTGKPTGVVASEMTAPYYAFQDAGMAVDVASIKGGPIPIAPGSLKWPTASADVKRYKADQQFLSKVARSLEIGMVDMESYDIVFLAGGWGAAYDLGQSETLGEQISKAYANDAVVGGICHGPLGLLQAKAPDGSPLVEGRKICAVTDKQIEELGIMHTPMHPERDLRAAGVEFESNTAFRDMFATHVVVDGRLVTGQNQNSGTETAHRMMEVVAEAKVDDASDVSDSSPVEAPVEGPVEGNEQQVAEQQVVLTSERFLGTYEFSGGDVDRQNLTSAIDALSADISLLIRGTAKKRISKLSAIQEWIGFSAEEGPFTYTDASGAKWVGDCDGGRYEGTTLGGKQATFTRSLSHNDEGLLVLTEQRNTESSSRTHRYILSEDGNSLRLEIAFENGRLPRALEYALMYNRKP
jgi:putative intracellular protease/amidase